MGCGASTSDKNKVPEPVTAASLDANLRSFVVWEAKGLPDGDIASRADPYCIARIGTKGSNWQDKPRSGGRRCEPIKGTHSPEWRMGFTVDLRGVSDPEFHVRVYDKDWASEDDFLGEALISLSELGDEVRKELALSGQGHPRGFVTVGSGPVGFLEAQGIKPSSYYEELAPQGELKSVKIADINGEGPFRIGGEQLPEALRGLFWLTDQKQSSAIASFGGPSKDGGGCCNGRLDKNRALVRVGGDRVWSMADSGVFSWRAVQGLDLIYHFVFDDAQNPTHCQIFPEARNLNITLTAEWLLDFEMELNPNSEEYPGSVVWKRLSYVGGRSYLPYDLVQVMDQSGNRLEPAWSKFVEYMKTAEAGSTPDTIFYREIV